MLDKAIEVNTELAIMLVRSGADLEKVKEDCAAIHTAACYNEIEVIKEMLKRGADINLLDANGRTAVHCAIQIGSKSTLEFLLDNGPDLTIRYQTYNAVEFAIIQAFCLQVFLDRGAPINARLPDGTRALKVAAQK